MCDPWNCLRGQLLCADCRIACTAAIGLMCVMATLYELYVLPHKINACEDFEYNRHEVASAEMLWLQSLRPEHEKFIKETGYNTPMYRLVKVASTALAHCNLKGLSLLSSDA